MKDKIKDLKTYRDCTGKKCNLSNHNTSVNFYREIKS